MRIAILSDIHSNFEALESVLESIEKESIDEIISLGDNIGYGADPEKVIKTMQANNIKSVLGNHEAACIDQDALLSFNTRAKKALLINKEMLSSESLKYIASLQVFIIRHNCRFVHGMPPSSYTKYIKYETNDALVQILANSSEQLSFVGHTHTLKVYEYNRKEVKTKDIEKKKLKLDKNSSYIVSTGSVGQPRNIGIKAEYIIFDSVENTIKPRCVAYDNKKAAEKIIKAGIPEIYSLRVEQGISLKQINLI